MNKYLSRSDEMKIKIIGSDAHAALLGGLMACAGHEVVFSGISKTGLRILLPSGWINISHPNEDRISAFDFIFVTIKYNHLDNLNRERLSQQKADRIIFFNSDEGVYDLTTGTAESIRGLTLLTAVMLQPSDVELCTERSVLIIEKSRAFKRLFRSIKNPVIEFYEVDDIIPYTNSFFLMQLLFLPIALCHSTYNVFLSYPAGREIAYRVLSEGLETFRRKKRLLKKLPVMDPQVLIEGITKERGKGFENLWYSPDQGYNSILQSILTGREVEAGELNGRLVKSASEVSVDAQWNWRLIRKLSRVVKLGFYKDPEELYQAIK